ncbi:hypothetical protein [Microbacterium marinilacus]|uniref:Uncharacterized protein n=1 Tax=Microbacterium marinilacus TaxID=415209 RepID=A0ABP7B4S3_9MICO|nr:hypothetical protein [Microbacterium marinilacus]MBY0687847.1 hypothetical protein [Microbacterium marinilacus]
MLRAVDPAESPAPSAHRVPWHVVRDDAAHPLLVNEGSEALEYVRVYVADDATPPELEAWGRMPPGESRELCLCGCDLDDTTVTLAWFLPDDDREWVWSFVV